MNIQEIEAQVRQIPDFPSEGILFMDILPILKSPAHFQGLTRHLSDLAGDIDCVVGIEARGLILGAAIAMQIDKGFVPLRKAGKLPGEVRSISYGLEYGKDVIEIQKDILNPGEKVMLIDDVLATGGTLIAGVKLLRECGVQIQSVVVALEISGLPGRAEFEREFPDLKLHALMVK